MCTCTLSLSSECCANSLLIIRVICKKYSSVYTGKISGSISGSMGTSRGERDRKFHVSREQFHYRNGIINLRLYSHLGRFRLCTCATVHRLWVCERLRGVSSVYAPGVVHTDLSRAKNSLAFLFHAASGILIHVNVNVRDL